MSYADSYEQVSNNPVHYGDCDSFNSHYYGSRQGTCDCSATADVQALLTEIHRLEQYTPKCSCYHPARPEEAPVEPSPFCVYHGEPI